MKRFVDLRTSRLILRAFGPSDVLEFAAYRSDPEVARYQSWETPYPESAAGAFVEEMKDARPGAPGDWYQIAIVLRIPAR